MKHCIMMLLSASALSVLGQQLTPDYSQEIGKYKSASNYIVESYVSPKGDYSLLMTPGHFYLWDGTGKLLTERDLMPKSNESVENEPRLFKTVEEGSGFMVMPGGEAVVLLDWGIGKGMVEVIDLKSGKSQWKSNQIGFANSAEDMAKKEGTKLAASILVKETSMNGGGEERIKKSQNPFLISQDQSFASKYVKSLITPLPDGNILIKTEGGQEAYDINTGETLWEYKSFPLVVGGYAHTGDGNIILINDNPSLYGEHSSRNTIVMLDGKTGDERWQLDYAGPHGTAYMHIKDDLLILDKALLTVVDLNDGQLKFSTEINADKSIRSTKVGNFLASQNTPSPGQAQLKALNSLLDGDHIYTGYIKYSGINMVATGSLGNKTTIAKYDLNSGELLWEAEGLADAIEEIAFANSSKVYVRRQAWGKQKIFALDKNTGSVIEEVELDKGATLWTDQHLVLAGKKELQWYDLNNLSKPVKTVSYKESPFGEVQDLLMLENRLVAIGDAGIGWFDMTGELQQSIEVDDVSDWVATTDRVVLFGKKAATVVDLSNQRKIASIDYGFNSNKDVAMLNAEGHTMIILEDQEDMSAYTLD